MTWRLVLFAGLLAASGCSLVDRLGRGTGRLRLEQLGRSSRRLLDVPAETRFCSADTSLSILGFDHDWSAVVALRTAWPPAGRAFTIDSALGGLGSASVAARPLGDSVGVALTAVHGTLRLDGGRRVHGTLDVVARGASDTVHLVGRFDAPAPAPGNCAGP